MDAHRQRHFSAEEWSRLPLGLRQRWWRETDFNRLEPSDDLLRACREIIADEGAK